MAFAISKSAQFDRGQKLHYSKKFKLQFSLKESYQSFFLNKFFVQISAQLIESQSEFFHRLISLLHWIATIETNWTKIPKYLVYFLNLKYN